MGLDRSGDGDLGGSIQPVDQAAQTRNRNSRAPGGPRTQERADRCGSAGELIPEQQHPIRRRLGGDHHTHPDQKGEPDYDEPTGHRGGAPHYPIQAPPRSEHIARGQGQQNHERGQTWETDPLVSGRAHHQGEKLRWHEQQQ